MCEFIVWFSFSFLGSVDESSDNASEREMSQIIISGSKICI